MLLSHPRRAASFVIITIRGGVARQASMQLSRKKKNLRSIQKLQVLSALAYRVASDLARFKFSSNRDVFSLARENLGEVDTNLALSRSNRFQWFFMNTPGVFFFRNLISRGSSPNRRRRRRRIFFLLTRKISTQNSFLPSTPPLCLLQILFLRLDMTFYLASRFFFSSFR
jgi:hypothetical protein